MEDRVKKYRRQKLIVGFLGVFLGLVAIDLLGFSGGRIARFVLGVFSAIIAHSLHDLYHHFKHPKMAETQRILDKDERNLMVQGKASYYTFKITLYALVIPITIGIIMENMLLTYFSIGLYMFIFIVFSLSKLYWNKRI